MVAWAAFGLLAYVVLIATDRLIDGSPTTAKWLGAGDLPRRRHLPADAAQGGVPAALPIPGRIAVPLRRASRARLAISGSACITACTASDAAGGS